MVSFEYKNNDKEDVISLNKSLKYIFQSYEI